MKHLLLTTIAAVLIVGCGESQQSAPPAESQPAEPVAEALQQAAANFDLAEYQYAKPETPTAKAPDISIHDAAERGNIKAVKQHLAAGTDVNAKDIFGCTPLHFAAENGRKEIVERLIAVGAEVNAERDDGCTPFHFAAANDRKEVAEMLIAAGADVNAKTKYGSTPLDWAIRFDETETGDLLRKHGGKTGEELKAEVK